jgi:hypothetical protein
MAGKSSTEKELRWREILRRQAGSGRSVREFCAAEAISEPSFYWWRRKLRERKNAGGRSRAQRKAKPSGDASEDGRLFVPLTLLDAPRTLEIIHPLGCRIQVTGDVNPVALRHVIEALDGRGER